MLYQTEPQPSKAELWLSSSTLTMSSPENVYCHCPCSAKHVLQFSLLHTTPASSENPVESLTSTFTGMCSSQMGIGNRQSRLPRLKETHSNVEAVVNSSKKATELPAGGQNLGFNYG